MTTANQVNDVYRLRKVQIGQEVTPSGTGTYGTTPGTLYDMRFNDSGATISLVQDNPRNEAQSTRMHDELLTVQALKSWDVSGSFNLRCESSQLNAAATAVTSSITELLTSALGGASAAGGSAVIGTPSTTSVPVTNGQATRFTVGAWCAVGVSGVLYPAKSTTVNTGTDILTVWPALPSAPAVAQLVINGYNNWPAETNVSSLALTLASAQQSGMQWTLNTGLVNDLGFSLSRTGLVSASCKIMGKSWTGPSAQSLATTAYSESQTAPLACRDAYMFLQTPATTTRVAYSFISCDLKISIKRMHLEEFSGANEQTSGTFNVGDRMFATATIKCRFDPDIEGFYTNQSQVTLVIVVPSGSGTSKRFVIFEMPLCYINAKPQTSEESGRTVMTFTLMSQLSTANSSQTVGTAAAPFVLARI